MDASSTRWLPNSRREERRFKAEGAAAEKTARRRSRAMTTTTTQGEKLLRLLCARLDAGTGDAWARTGCRTRISRVGADVARVRLGRSRDVRGVRGGVSPTNREAVRSGDGAARAEGDGGREGGARERDAARGASRRADATRKAGANQNRSAFARVASAVGAARAEGLGVRPAGPPPTRTAKRSPRRLPVLRSATRTPSTRARSSKKGRSVSSSGVSERAAGNDGGTSKRERPEECSDEGRLGRRPVSRGDRRRRRTKTDDDGLIPVGARVRSFAASPPDTRPNPPRPSARASSSASATPPCGTSDRRRRRRRGCAWSRRWITRATCSAARVARWTGDRRRRSRTRAARTRCCRTWGTPRTCTSGSGSSARRTSPRRGCRGGRGRRRRNGKSKVDGKGRGNENGASDDDDEKKEKGGGTVLALLAAGARRRRGQRSSTRDDDDDDGDDDETRRRRRAPFTSSDRGCGSCRRGSPEQSPRLSFSAWGGR